MDITDLQHGALLQGTSVDASRNRERRRQRRLGRLLLVIGIPLAYFWYRELTGDPLSPGLPQVIRDSPELTILVVLIVLMFGMMLIPFVGAGRSPHTLLRPTDSDIRPSV